MYSALHHQGKRLYELAREGKKVEREPRNVTISSLSLVDHDQQSLTLDVHCSKGTYIRSLVEDIGEALGCGAYVAELRRLSVAPFRNPAMVTLEQLEKRAVEGEQVLLDVLIPMDEALAHWPLAHLDMEQTRKIMQGQSVFWDGADTEKLRLYAQTGQFIGIGRIQSANLLPKRLINQEVIDFL